MFETILDSLDADNRARVERVIVCEIGTVGRSMSMHVWSAGPKVTGNVVLRWRLKHDALPLHTDALISP